VRKDKVELPAFKELAMFDQSATLVLTDFVGSARRIVVCGAAKVVRDADPTI